MDKKLQDCLNGNHNSYILPFLWLHGEPKERVKEEILAIKNSGINEFCAESRPYEKFCQDQWWDDFGFILKTAKELDMNVWLLDDKAFPTGYANGYLEREENAHLRKKLVRELQIEAVGPMKNAKFFVGGRVNEGEKIISVVAYKHRGDNNGEGYDYKTAVDLTDTLRDGMIYWSVPNGIWRVCITVETKPYDYENDRFFYYIDMLSKDSCHAMIDAIYEPHYDHFKEYFGNTFKGFFSDEPGFLNVLYTYYNTLGKIESPYPWREDLPELIANSAGIDEKTVKLSMSALWEDLGEITWAIRMHYMEVITKLYSENFSYALGDWCRDHDVMYIGHVIEDMGAHTRMGYGSGHYFRALDGQDMAGIDIVLTQDMPGVLNNVHRSLLTDGGAADPAFFHYTLPKLAASHSHIQPLKKNRAMCEIFGAFGWAEGLPYMKGLADTMLSSGVNYFVPHAFSPKEEDPDCPPHFYNGGKNIQYPKFKSLMEYMGRCSHMLSDSVHKADVAVFYNAEGEWTGCKNRLFYDLCRKLTQNLIDFDIIPYDALKDAKIQNGRLCVNNEDYGALIISESEAMPYDRLSLFNTFAKNGLPIIFENSLPKKSAENIDISKLLPSFEAISFENIPKSLRSKGLSHLSACGNGIENLRFYHVKREHKDIYLFSNDDTMSTVNAEIKFEQDGDCLIYDPWGNKLYQAKAQSSELDLQIEKGNMLFVIFGEEIPNGTPCFTKEAERKTLPLLFDIEIKEEGENEYRKIAEKSQPFDISAPDKFPSFSGYIRYTATFDSVKDFTVIDLGEVGEVGEVYINGVNLGTRINAPYKFSMSGSLKEKDNEIEIIVTSNLGHRRRDFLSTFIQIPPTGIVDNISLCRYSK